MTRTEINQLFFQVKSVFCSDALVPSCSRDKCDVSTARLPNPLLIADVDSKCLTSKFPGKKPDFIVVCPDRVRDPRQLIAIPLELKSGHFSPAEVAEQLQAGAEFLENHIPLMESCRPIVVGGLDIRVRQLKKLNREKIQFRGRGLTILLARCGEPRNLFKALNE